MELLQNKRIVYDGACPLSISLSAKVLALGIFPAEKIANYDELPEAQSAQIDADRFHNEMALIDLNGGETIYGPDALKHIFSERSRLAKMFFAIPGIMVPIRFVYRTLAYNRYMISTPRKDMITSNRETDAPPRFHFTYLAYSLIIALAVTFLFGMGLTAYFPAMSKAQGGLAMLLIAGTGWVLQGLISVIALGQLRFQYLRHLFTIMRKGVMPLLPVALLLLVFPQLHPIVPALAVLLSSSLMLRQHYLRIWRLSASQVWTGSWFLALQVTAFSWVLYYFPTLSF